jgi:group I intron endonuclease
MEYGVYKHIAPNGKVYIGITSQNPDERWKNGNGYHKGTFFRNAIDKYGCNNILHEILYTDLTKEEAEQKEIEFIAKCQSNNREFGYNIANGGFSNGKHSEETRKKISEKAKGRVPSEETRKKIGKANKGKLIKDKNPMYGKHHTEESRKKLSESHKGNKNSMRLSEEARKKVSEAMKGNKNPMYGTHHTGEEKRKISEALKGNKNPNYGKQLSKEQKEAIRKANSKSVRCIETDIVYCSVKIASELTGIDKTSIAKVCCGKQKTAGGYHWEYVE